MKLILLHAISCGDRRNTGLQTGFDEFQISMCVANFQLIYFLLHLPFLIYSLLLLSKRDLSLLLCLYYQVN